MSEFAVEKLPALAAALMRMRGDTLASVGAATGIRPANLSVWLRGKEQVISAKRVTALMHFLGVQGGTLRSDVLHRWSENGELTDLKHVLSTLKLGGPEIWLFEDSETGLTKTRYLKIDEAWVRLEFTQGVTQLANLVEIVCPHRLFTVPITLAGLPLSNLEETRQALLVHASYIVKPEDAEILADIIRRIECRGPSNRANSNKEGWHQLETALISALREGLSPLDIALIVTKTLRSGGNAASGRNQVSV